MVSLSRVLGVEVAMVVPVEQLFWLVLTVVLGPKAP